MKDPKVKTMLYNKSLSQGLRSLFIIQYNEMKRLGALKSLKGALILILPFISLSIFRLKPLGLTELLWGVSNKIHGEHPSAVNVWHTADIQQMTTIRNPK